MKKIAFLVLLATFSGSSFAQLIEEPDEVLIEEPQDGDAPAAPAPPPRASRPGAPAPSAAPARRGPPPGSEDYIKPGWNSKNLDHGIGFNASFLGVGNAFIYEKGLTRPRSWSFYLGFAKSTDTATNSSTSATSGIGPVTSTTTTVASGSKNPMTLSLGASHNWRLYKNSFLETRFGVFTGIDYYTETKYDTGTVTVTSSSAVPGTVTVVESSRGTVAVEKSPSLRIGPVFDTNVFLRWFPNISAGMQGGIIYASNMKTKTRTKTTSQTYTIVNGVQSAPTAYAQSDKTDTLDTGGTGSTLVIAGQNFGFAATFTIRYVW